MRENQVNTLQLLKSARSSQIIHLFKHESFLKSGQNLHRAAHFKVLGIASVLLHLVCEVVQQNGEALGPKRAGRVQLPTLPFISCEQGKSLHPSVSLISKMGIIAILSELLCDQI